MYKKIYDQTQLACLLQENTVMNPSKCLTGVLSQTPNGFCFEEAIRKGRAPRNPKLFDGKYISMVRMQNGRYQIHFKTMDQPIDREHFAFGVYCEVAHALQVIDR